MEGLEQIERGVGNHNRVHVRFRRVPIEAMTAEFKPAERTMDTRCPPYIAIRWVLDVPRMGSALLLDRRLPMIC